MNTNYSTKQKKEVFNYSVNSTLRLAVIAAFMLLSITNANAQTPSWQWAKHMVGDWGLGFNVTVDDSGNVYSTGSFGGTVDFNPAPGPFAMYNLTATGNIDDTYISKLNNSGNFVWAKAFTGPPGTGGYGITLDNLGNVYSVGAFNAYNNSPVDFDPGAGIYNLMATGTQDIYISKLDNAGNFVWAKSLSGTVGVDFYNTGRDLIIDPVNSNVYIAGWYTGTVDFDPGAGVYNLTSDTTIVESFILKLDSSGSFLWAKSLAGIGEATSIALDNAGNVYTGGLFGLTVDFDPGIGTYYLTAVDSIDIYISKLNTLGEFVWAKQIGGIGAELIESMAIDLNANGAIYASGEFTGTTDFDPGTGTYNLTSNGERDIFILKLDSACNLLWVKAIGGVEDDIANALAVDPLSHDVYTTGWFHGTVDFNPDAATTLFTSAGSSDIFLTRFDDAGNFVWVKTVGGTNYDEATSIVIDAIGNPIITGYFASASISFVGSNLINLTGNPNIFIAKLDLISAIENVERTNSISIYPNPANGLLTISYPILVGKDVTITITDITGKIIYQTTTTSSEKLEVNTSEFSEGVYLVRVQSKDFVETKKVMITK